MSNKQKQVEKLNTEQQAVVDNQGGSLLVSAAAGSGKTKVLVDRLLDRVMQQGKNLDEFLIITFTKAAAAELRTRILKKLNERIDELQAELLEKVTAVTDEEQAALAHLQQQTVRIYRTQISTIDSFCQTILEEEGYRISIDPNFQVDDNACNLLQQIVLDRLLEDHYKKSVPGDKYSTMVDTFTSGGKDKALGEMILHIYSKLQSNSDPVAWLQDQRDRFDIDRYATMDDTDWAKTIIAESKTEVSYWQDKMSGLMKEVQENGQLKASCTTALITLLESLDSIASGLNTSWDSVHPIKSLDVGKLSGKNSGPQNLIDRYMSLRADCKKRINKVLFRFTRSSSEALSDLRLVAPAVNTLLDLVAEFDQAFTAEKERQNLLDYSDIEHMALQILLDSDGNPSAAARDMQEKYFEIMVDEYQDTNQVQNSIFYAISKNKTNLFMVGDVKQSIYRFRQADPTIFIEKYETFRDYATHTDADPILPGTDRKLVMSNNFRSLPTVLDGANYVFRSLMTKEFGEIDYTQDHWLRGWRAAPENIAPFRTELHVLDATYLKDQDASDSQGDDEGEENTEEKASQKESNSPITKQKAEADYIARRILRLKSENHPVYDVDQKGYRPVEWDDIVILQRSLNSSIPDLTAALDFYGIPWAQTNSQNILTTTEIAVATSYLQIIDNPHQDIPLISVLRSPLYGFTADRLAAIRANSPYADFYVALSTYAQLGDGDCSRFLQQLEGLRIYAKEHNIADLIWELYQRTAMLPVFTAMKGGETRREHLIALYEDARQFGQTGKSGLFDYMNRLKRMQDSDQSVGIKGSNGVGVRLMTIHGSKGLEFPVVILSGLSRLFNTKDEKAEILFHPDLGVGPTGLEKKRATEQIPRHYLKFSTAAREAVTLKMRREAKAEELRLLYVAMTRARDKLIMVTSFSGENYLSNLHKIATYPVAPEELIRMNNMGDWLVTAAMTRKNDICFSDGEETPGCLCDGHYPKSCFEEEDLPWEVHLVVQNAVHQETPLDNRVDAATQITTEEFRNRVNWQYLPTQRAAEEHNGIPAKLTPSQLGHSLNKKDSNTDAKPWFYYLRRPSLSADKETLSPTERGTAVHLFMQLCDPEKGTTVIGVQEELERLVQDHFMTPQQAEVCEAEKVVAFFTSDLGKLARRSEMHKEFNFSILVDASEYYDSAADQKILVQGVVDLWFETQDGIVIVDFKTDAVSSDAGMKEKAEHYRPQLAVYAKALERITGKRVVSRYLWFTATNTAYEVK